MSQRICAFVIGFAALGLTASPAAANTITIPWNLDFTFVRGADTQVLSNGVHSGTIALQPFDAAHQIQTRVEGKVEIPIIGTDVAGIDVTAGLRFQTEARDAYHISLPYEITLTAPDHATAGKSATITTDIHFAGTPTMQTNGQLSFGTGAFAHGSAFVGPFDGNINVDADLPSFVPLGGGNSVTFGGSGSYSASASGGKDVSIGPFAKQSLSSNQVFAASTSRFDGTQLQTEGRIDAQRASVNLLDIIQEIPVVGTPAAIANTVLDLDLQAGVDMIDRSTLSTGAIYALYTGDDFASTHTVALNPLGANGFSTLIPNDATGTYDIDFYGLGIGLGLLQEEYLTPELQLVLDAIDPLGSWKLFQADVGDPWLIGRQTSRFQYEEFFQFSNYGGYIPPDQRTLSFNLDGGASAPPTIQDPGIPIGDGDGFGDQAPLGGSASLPGTAPTEGMAIPLSAVPEPASWAMLLTGFGMLGVLLRDRRRRVQPGEVRAA